MVRELAERAVAAGGLRIERPFSASAVVPYPQPHRLYDVLQRTLDLSLSLLLLVVALPLLLLACLAILLTTREAPLLVQRRVGWLGQEFPLLKLRTMREEGEPRPLTAKSQRDDRVTAVGRILRRTSIDELPQLFNVLAGHMTLVGPRPGLPAEVAAYRPQWRRRLSVRPGLTGLWQVSGRSSLPIQRWMALDRAYLKHRSTGFDLAVLLRSLPAVITMRGAW